MTDTKVNPLFRLIDNSATTPVILHAPHGGRTIPAVHLGSYVISLAELEAEKDVMTDHFTDELVAGISGASSLINGLSRFAVDVERFPDDTENLVAQDIGADLTDPPAFLRRLVDLGNRIGEMSRPG